MKKGLIATLIGVVLLGGGTAAAYYTISGNTETAVRSLLAAEPLVQLASYDRGLTGSRFQLHYPTIGMRLDGRIEHGPLLLGSLTPALDRIRLQLNPQVDADSPLAQLLTELPELAQASMEITVGYGGALTLSGQAPAIDRTLTTDGKALHLVYDGGSLTGSGRHQNNALKDMDLTGELGSLQLSADGLAFALGPMRLTENVQDIQDNLPGKLVATMSADTLSLRATPADKPAMSLEATGVRFTEEAGTTPDQTLHGQGGVTVDQLVVNGEQIDQLAYQVRFQGLRAAPLRELQRLLASFQEKSGQTDPNALMAELAPQMLPQLHALFAGATELGIDVKGHSASFGDNSFRINAALNDGGSDYLSRLTGQLALEVAQPLAQQLTLLYLASQAQANPGAQLPKVEQVLGSLIEQGMIAQDPTSGQYLLGIRLDGAQDSLTLDAGMPLPPPSVLAQMMLANQNQPAAAPQ